MAVTAAKKAIASVRMLAAATEIFMMVRKFVAADTKAVTITERVTVAMRKLAAAVLAAIAMVLMVQKVVVKWT